MESTESPPESDLQASGYLFARLRKKGLRPTSARICILQVLQANNTVSYFAEQLFRELSDIGISVSLGTIYRVLHGLEQAGLVLREDLAGKSRYTVAPAVLPPHAYTVVCRRCGRGFVLEDKGFSELLHRRARAGGFDLGLGQLGMRVTCNACHARAPAPADHG